MSVSSLPSVALAGWERYTNSLSASEWLPQASEGILSRQKALNRTALAFESTNATLETVRPALHSFTLLRNAAVGPVARQQASCQPECGSRVGTYRKHTPCQMYVYALDIKCIQMKLNNCSLWRTELERSAACQA